MATLAKFIGTDENGLPVEAYFDLEKAVEIIDIPDEFEWSLKTDDVNSYSDITEFIGSQKKH